MKRTVTTTNGVQPIIIEEFNSFNELISVNDSRTPNFSSGGGRANGNDEWNGASYEEAVEMLRYGWQDKEKVSIVKDKIAKLEKLHDVQKMSFKNDIVGYAPIVPLALKGVPQNMINMTRTPKKAKVIKIIIDIGVDSKVTAEEKLEWGAKVVSKIMSLEKQGFRVKLECVKTFIEGYDTRDKAHACKVPIKNENQPFDIQRMMFPIAHIAMSRRILFDWYERLPEARYIWGHGRSLQYHSNKKHVELIKKTIADTENSYYISIADDIDRVLEGVR